MLSSSTSSSRSRWLPLASATLLMGALVAVTVVVEARTTTHRRELNRHLLPTAALSGRVAFYLSREMGQLRAWAITGEERFLVRYLHFRSAEEGTWGRLLDLVGALEPELAQRILDLRSATARWHRSTEAISPALGAAPTEDTALLLDTELYESILARFDTLSSELDHRAGQRIAALERVEAAQTAMTMVLALLAVGAAAGATWLVGRTQALAAEADRRREEVQRLSEGRLRLMRGLTHDVKNPLGAAVGYAELVEVLAGDRLLPEHCDWLARIRTTVGRATEILDDLLELSQAEAGQLPMAPRSLSLPDILEEAASEEAVQFDGAGIGFHRHVPADLPPVYADPRRVRQVLGNVLANARKYTPAGGRVTLRADVRSGFGEPGAPGRGPWVAVEVSDTGPGIPPEKQRAVFDEFIRLDPDAAPGLGLGLAISRRLALLLGGDLTLVSRPGGGSTFTLWLPVHAGRGERRAA